MDHMIPADATTPQAPAVLSYARDAGGLEVEQAAGVVAIDIPPRLRLGIRHATGAAVLCAVAIGGAVGAGLYGELRWDDVLTAVVVSSLVMFCVVYAMTLWIVGYYTQSARVEVTADAVRLTVTGIRLNYTTQWPRSEITDVQRRFHGVRLSLRGRLRGGWIPFGSGAQQRDVCARLREALALPPAATQPR
jgi:hypothetical protein